MATDAVNPEPVEEEDQLQDDSLGARFMDFVRNDLIWYAGSFTFHLLLGALLFLIPSTGLGRPSSDSPSFDEVQAEDTKEDKEQKPLEPIDIGDPEEEQPTELDVDPTLEKPAVKAQTEDYIDESKVYTPQGGGMKNGSNDASGTGGFSIIAYGNGAKVGKGEGLGVGLGTGNNWGKGGSGTGFGGRGSGHRKAQLARDGGNKHTERAVTAALIWLLKHQMQDGSWSLSRYTTKCTDNSCTGTGTTNADTGATAMGLLPFLAAGQTHKTKGSAYKVTVGNAINWLIHHQKANGNLAEGCIQPMYSHGLATIALCEAYGLTADKNIGVAAQGAVNYIINAQNQNTGGWRYTPGEEGDTSVVGWQVMALKSAVMAGLIGGSQNGFNGASKWLDSVKSGPYDSNFAYVPGQGATPTMSSVGLLCRQYLGEKRDSQMMGEGIKYLMNHLPEKQLPNVYYWYYATQVMHNMNGYEWDEWNRKMRKMLCEMQCKDYGTCANGSWNPAGDQWARIGGRLMMTSLACLTLEIYYRYLPLFKAGDEGGAAPPPAANHAPKKAAKPADEEE